MKLRALAVLLLPFLLVQPLRASSKSDASPTPSLLDQTLTFLHLKHPARQKDTGEVHDGIELKMAVDPSPFKLSDTREVKVTLILVNRTPKRFIHLNFPTSQRIEAIVHDPSGKVIETWSEDQSFTNDPASVTINPGERVEYNASIPTREMAPGQSYNIELSVPSYPGLKISQAVVPQA